MDKNLFEKKQDELQALLVVKHDFEIDGVKQTVWALKASDLQAMADRLGLTNTFGSSTRITEGWKYTFHEADADYEVKVIMKWHSPDSGALDTSVSKYVYTAQLEIDAIDKATGIKTIRFLRAAYSNGIVRWVRNNSQKWAHIPVIMDTKTPPSPSEGEDRCGPTDNEEDGADPEPGLRFLGNNSEMTTQEKGVVHMTGIFNDLLDKAYSFFEGKPDTECSEDEIKEVVEKFQELASLNNVTHYEISLFEQLATILFCFNRQDAIAEITIANSDLKDIFDEIEADFSEE